MRAMIRKTQRAGTTPYVLFAAVCTLSALNSCTTNTAAPLPDGQARFAVAPSAVYPLSALSTCASGYAVVKFDLGADGVTRNESIIESQPSEVFDEAALRAVRGTSWLPKVQGGKAVASTLSQRVDFDVPSNCVPFDVNDPVDEPFDQDGARNACFASGGNRWDFAELQFVVGEDGYPTQIIVDEMSSPRMEALARQSLAKQQFDPEFIGQTLAQTMEHCSR